MPRRGLLLGGFLLCSAASMFTAIDHFKLTATESMFQRQVSRAVEQRRLYLGLPKSAEPKVRVLPRLREHGTQLGQFQPPDAVYLIGTPYWFMDPDLFSSSGFSEHFTRRGERTDLDHVSYHETSHMIIYELARELGVHYNENAETSDLFLEYVARSREPHIGRWLQDLDVSSATELERAVCLSIAMEGLAEILVNPSMATTDVAYSYIYPETLPDVAPELAVHQYLGGRLLLDAIVREHGPDGVRYVVQNPPQSLAELPGYEQRALAALEVSPRESMSQP